MTGSLDEAQVVKLPGAAGERQSAMHPSGKGVAEGFIASFLFTVIASLGGYAASRAGYSLAPVVVAYPLWAVGVAVSLGVAMTAGTSALFQRYRHPRPTGYNSVAIDLPCDDPDRYRQGQIEVLESRQVSWHDFLHGVDVLYRQIGESSWRPDLVIALNQGHVIVGLIREHPKLSKAQFGSIVLDSERKRHSVALPPRPKVDGPHRTLLVDYQKKRGSAVDAALAILQRHRLGVELEHTRVAVVVLGAVRKIPAPGRSYKLADPTFYPHFDQFPEDLARARVSRLFYLAFFCRDYPVPPWRREPQNA